ncbi:MAG: prolyl oligopeptidase family serine peptidase, partial [Candidatus Hydrogenedentota bacterium]
DGTVPQGEPGSRPTHEFSGPTRFGSTSPMNGAKEDYWVYHAIGDIVLAHSLLGSQPEVDAGRIGLTGISWGGFLTCLAAAVDSRFQFAIPVYGCGFIDELSWKKSFDEMEPEKAEEWMRLWDPSHYVAAISMPTLWLTGATDPHYHLGAHSRTYLQAGGTKTLSIQPGLGHSHPAGWAPEEIYAYADSKLKNETPLIRIVAQGGQATSAMAVFEGERPAKAELMCTSDAGDWGSARWVSIPATIEGNRILAELPKDCAAYFFNLTDARGLITSSVCRLRK